MKKQHNLVNHLLFSAANPWRNERKCPVSPNCLSPILVTRHFLLATSEPSRWRSRAMPKRSQFRARLPAARTAWGSTTSASTTTRSWPDVMARAVWRSSRSSSSSLGRSRWPSRPEDVSSSTSTGSSTDPCRPRPPLVDPNFRVFFFCPKTAIIPCAYEKYQQK